MPGSGSASSGRVVLLNGTSSAGKSSLARALQGALPTPWVFLSADNVLGGYPFDHPAADTSGAWRSFGRLFYETVGLFAARGFDVIAEQVFQQRVQLDDAVAVLPADRVWFVGVRCSLSVASAREVARGDGTKPGTAAYQYDRVHAHGVYDVEVDTTSCTPDEAAAVVARAIGAVTPSAFSTLVRRSE